MAVVEDADLLGIRVAELDLVCLLTQVATS